MVEHEEDRVTLNYCRTLFRKAKVRTLLSLEQPPF
jgi:hypothetical protein